MKNEELRPAAGAQGIRSGKGRLWEHVQVDIAAESLADGEESIHLLRDAGIEIRAVIVDGAIIDFRAIPVGDTLTLPTLPPFDLSSESYGPYRHSLVYRSWSVPALGLTIHVESWVEKKRGGFVDVFTKSGP